MPLFTKVHTGQVHCGGALEKSALTRCEIEGLTTVTCLISFCSCLRLIVLPDLLVVHVVQFTFSSLFHIVQAEHFHLLRMGSAVLLHAPLGAVFAPEVPGRTAVRSIRVLE